MALSRMCRISDLCSSRYPVLLRPQRCDAKFAKQTRQFRKGRNQEYEKINENPDSVATPFTVLTEARNLTFAHLWKPFLFTVGFTSFSLVGAAIWEYENMRSHAQTMLKRPIRHFKAKLEQGGTTMSGKVKKWWNSLSPGERVFVPICAINLLVFAAWRVPRLQPIMLKYFCSNPGSSSVVLPMVLSTFSHYSLFHLLANMYVLHSFSTGAVHSLGQEQFLALYLGAGVISSFTSYVYKVIVKKPGLSLGASGAIMGILGYVCTQYPDTRLGIILIPFFTFSAGAAIKFIVGLDTAGVLMGWKFFDHAAHLGGAATGILYALYGNKYIWQKREPILQYWHDIRGSIK
ncbi:presenilins-associated rhomboid-like protein, mitochondrial isoform X2 [Aethina tumida]|uniref:presenilins-associated rhomboid-like protein, mitochondrial isoform X2 n=1 Tax=Aethina tumida TaxID=116153 RepID=UPI00096B4FD2|nr:presenilins-associated rhomboid-like protein, mitochondrial isoform X2 [Aethina tumida]